MMFACSFSCAVMTPSSFASSLQYSAKGRLSVVVRENFSMNARGIAISEEGGKLHFRMFQVITLNKAANKPDDDVSTERGRVIKWVQTKRCGP